MKRPVYAENTTVPIDRTKAEIETTLAKYGATAFAYASRPEGASIAFDCQQRRVRFELPLKPLRTQEQTSKRNRSRWRALCMTIKAKLVTVESGIETFEEAFLPHIVMPSGQTVGDSIIPQIAARYKEGDPGPLLLERPR
jgi:hypothetical protein